MMSCSEAYTAICGCVSRDTTGSAKEALFLLQQFKEIITDCDAALCDAQLLDICRRLPELHFKRECPLTTLPEKTIQEEYLKASGKIIPTFICEKAYYQSQMQKDCKADTDSSRSAIITAEEAV